MKIPNGWKWWLAAGACWAFAACRAAEPVAPLSRQDAVQQTLRVINKELADHGGSFEKWGEGLREYREDLAKIRAGKWPWPARKKFVFDGREISLVMLDTFDNQPDGERPFDIVLDTDRKLKAEGIDLIFVVIPDKLAVYPDYILTAPPPRPEGIPTNAMTGLSDADRAELVKLLGGAAASQPKPESRPARAPADRMVYPAVKHLMKRLLENDVEVVDLYPAFREARLQNEDRPLFYDGDNHWRNVAAQLAAEKIAERLQRYDFVQKALAEEKRYSVQPEYREDKPDPLMVVLDTRTGGRYADAAQSPILITGDSNLMYNMGARAGHMPAHIGRHINMPISFAPNTIPPEHLAKLGGRRVVIWANIARMLVGCKWPTRSGPASKPPPKPATP